MNNKFRILKLIFNSLLKLTFLFNSIIYIKNQKYINNYKIINKG